MHFYSPSRGKLSFKEVFHDLMNYISSQPEESYKLIIGTDSNAYFGESVVFVTAIVIHRVGKGGVIFFKNRGSLLWPAFVSASIMRPS